MNQLLTGKLSSRVLKNTLFRHYKTLQLAYIWKYFKILKAKGQDNLQDTEANIYLYIKINIYLNSWTKFLHYNRQPSSAVKFNSFSHTTIFFMQISPVLNQTTR